jgi:hypothetical protein
MHCSLFITVTNEFSSFSFFVCRRYLKYYKLLFIIHELHCTVSVAENGKCYSVTLDEYGTEQCILLFFLLSKLSRSYDILILFERQFQL